MTGKVSWIDFLNESATWETKVQADLFWSNLLGLTHILNSTEISELSKAESYMREQLNALHFGRPIEFDFLNEKLAMVHLRLRRTSDGGEEPPSMPVLTALRKGTSSPILRMVDTWLLQFACFLGDVSDGNAPYTVNRCAAIYPKKQVSDCQSFYRKYRSIEDTWRGEVVSEQTLDDGLERCADFFVVNRFGKFCSDACRFNSFALRKKSESPNYQAEKQRRYRERQKLK